MASKDDGGPAFPRPASEYTSGERGMSLRDWFAGQALAGLCADGAADLDVSRVPSPQEGGSTETSYGDIADRLDLAEEAYRIADCMLGAREEEANGT